MTRKVSSSSSPTRALLMSSECDSLPSLRNNIDENGDRPQTPLSVAEVRDVREEPRSLSSVPDLKDGVDGAATKTTARTRSGRKLSLRKKNSSTTLDNADPSSTKTTVRARIGRKLSLRSKDSTKNSDKAEPSNTQGPRRSVRKLSLRTQKLVGSLLERVLHQSNDNKNNSNKNESAILLQRDLKARIENENETSRPKINRAKSLPISKKKREKIKIKLDTPPDLLLERHPSELTESVCQLHSALRDMHKEQSDEDSDSINSCESTTRHSNMSGLSKNRSRTRSLSSGSRSRSRSRSRSQSRTKRHGSYSYHGYSSSTSTTDSRALRKQRYMDEFSRYYKGYKAKKRQVEALKIDLAAQKKYSQSLATQLAESKKKVEHLKCKQQKRQNSATRSLCNSLKELKEVHGDVRFQLKQKKVQLQEAEEALAWQTLVAQKALKEREEFQASEKQALIYAETLENEVVKIIATVLKRTNEVSTMKDDQWKEYRPEIAASLGRLRAFAAAAAIDVKQKKEAYLAPTLALLELEEPPEVNGVRSKKFIRDDESSSPSCEPTEASAGDSVSSLTTHIPQFDDANQYEE